MFKKSRGQEATEFVLITSLVFIASLLTMFIFRDQIALFFKNNQTSQKHEVADYTASTNSASAIGGKASVDHPGGTITMDGGNVIVDLPNPSAFTQSEVAAKTTGSSADMLKLASDLGLYNLALSDSIAEVSNQTSNATISKIAKIVAAMGQLQGGGSVPGVLNYDTSTNPEWKTAVDTLDPTGTDPKKVSKLMSSIVDSLETTLEQLQTESATSDYAGNTAFIEDCTSRTCFNNTILIQDDTFNMTGMKQQDYARFLQSALSDLSTDSTVSADVKATVTALANEAQKIADEYTYKVTTDDVLTNNAFTSMESIHSNFGKSFHDLSGFSGKNKFEKGKMIMGWWNKFNKQSDSEKETQLSYLSPTQIQELVTVTKSLQIAIQTPAGGAVTTDLATQIQSTVDAAR